MSAFIDLGDIQYEMNQIVKNEMGSNPNWSLAASKLEYVLSHTASEFYDFIEDGNRPELSEYWFIFANLCSNLCFNYGAALFNDLCSKNIYGKEFEKVENALITATVVMPNSNEKKYLEYIQLIEEPYIQSLMRQGTLTKTSLVDFVVSKNFSLEQNLINFYTNIRDNYIPS